MESEYCCTFTEGAEEPGNGPLVIKTPPDRDASLRLVLCLAGRFLVTTIRSGIIIASII